MLSASRFRRHSQGDLEKDGSTERSFLRAENREVFSFTLGRASDFGLSC